MHAGQIILDLLVEKCPWMHAKRRQCLADMVEAARRGGLTLIGMSKAVARTCSLRHCIKRCDRLLSNPHLAQERTALYGALAEHVLRCQTHVVIIVDWSDLLVDVCQHLLRASVVVKGRSFVIYEEVHPTKLYGANLIHREFMKTVRTLLPAKCQPVIITDAGFRASWFKMLDELQFAWIGRIRNRDMVRACDAGEWQGCKTLYANTRGRARDLGRFEYVRSNPVQCRLVLIKKAKKGRQRKTAFGKVSRSSHSNKQAAAQREPWLLAVSPCLSKLSAEAVVAMYSARMQIEQSFRDLKCPRWGMGLRHSQTRQPERISILLLIGALLSLALWLIGLAVRRNGYEVRYGSRKKAATTLSILSLARDWLNESNSKAPPRRQLNEALIELASMLMIYEI